MSPAQSRSMFMGDLLRGGGSGEGCCEDGAAVEEGITL